MPKSLSKIVFKNSIFSVSSYFVQFIIVFVVTPYMLHKLGTTLFGIWALVSVVTSYTQLADFGIGRSIIKFVAEYDGKKDKSGLFEIINTSFILYIVLGSVSFTIFIFLDRFFVVKVLNIADEFVELTLFVYHGTITIFFTNLIFGVFRSTINGLQRMDITQSVLAVSSVLRAVGVFIVLEAGLGLKGLIIKNGLISFLAIVANYAFFKSLLPGISIRWNYFKIKRVKEILKFSLNVELSYLLRLLLDPVNKILISHFCSLDMVSFYEIAWRIISSVLSFSWRMMSSILPAGSMLDAQGRYDDLNMLYVKSSKYIAVAFLPLFCIVFLLARPFISVWLGPGYELSAIALEFMLFPYFFLILVNPANVLIQSIGYPQYSMITIAIRGLLNIFFVYIFIKYFGFIGFLIGNISAVLCSSIFILIAFHYVAKISLRNTIRGLKSLPVIQILMVSIICSFIFPSFNINSYPKLIMAGLCFSFTVILILLKSTWLDVQDRLILQKILPKRIYSILSPR